MQLRVRGGSSAFQWGHLTVTQYDSGCLRSIVFRQYADIKNDIDEIYQRVGAHHEALHEAKIKDQIVEREFVVKSEVTPGVIYSGRADFVLKNGIIHETKASLLKRGTVPIKPKVSYLAQLVSYMTQLERTEGAVVWGHYKETKDGFDQIGVQTFKVELAGTGQIAVDGAPTPFHAQEQLLHLNLAAKYLERKELHPWRPLNWESKWDSPCAYCPFKSVCDKFDRGSLTSAEAIAEVQKELGS